MTVVGEAWVKIRADGKGFAAETRAAVTPGMAAAEAEAKASGVRTGEAYAGGVKPGALGAAAAVEGSGGRMRKDMAATEATTGRFSLFHREKMGEMGKSFTGPVGGFSALELGAGGAAIGLAAAAGESVHLASSFQTLTTQLVTGAGESSRNLGMVRSGLLAIGDEVGVSADNLAKGMYNIESAGFHGAAGLNVMKVAAEGAKVGGADMATVTDAITSSLNAYHRPASDAASVTNDLIATVAAGKTHMQDLAGSLGQVLPIASQLHIPLNQVTGAMATMTTQGTGAARAATALRFMMTSLAAPSLKAKGAMDAVGLSSQKVGDTLTHHGLQAALEMVTTAVGQKFPKGSAAYVGALSDIVGGTRGMTAALELSGKNAGTFTQDVQKIGKASRDTSGEVHGWQLTQSTFSVQLSRLGAAVEGLGIKLGTLLLPGLTKVAKVTADAASWVGDHLGPALRQVGGWIGSAFGGKNQSTVTGMGRTFKDLESVANALLRVFRAVWNGVVAVFSTAYRSIVKIVGEVVNTIKHYLDTHQSQVHHTMVYVQGILHTLAQIWTAAFDLIKRIIQIATNWIMDLWRRFGAQLLSHIHTQLNAILEVIRGVFDVIRGVFDVVLGILTGKWGRAWNGIKEIAAGVWHIIGGVVKAGINDVSTVIGLVMAEVSAAWAHIWNGIKDVATSIWGSISGAFRSGANEVIGIVNDFIGLLDKIPFVHIGRIGLLSSGGGGGGGGGGGYGGGVHGGKVAMAHGGVLPGYAPGQDSVLVHASPGEGWLVPEAVRMVGGPQVIDSLNHKAAGHRGAGRPNPGGRSFGVGGVLSGIGHAIGGAASTVVHGAQDAFNLLTSPGKAIAGLVGHLGGEAGHLLSGLASKVLHDIVSGAMGMAGGGGGAKFTGSGSVRGWIMQALSLMHMSPGFLPGIASLIMHESGGNPNAINNTDINAQRGDPSRGLMQTIGSTFNAYVLPQLRGLGIYNPIANITAGVRYALANYGPGMLMSGGNHTASGGYAPYDVGGWLLPGMTKALNSTGRREAVMPEDVMVAAIQRSQNPAQLLKAIDEQTNYLAEMRDLLASMAGGQSYRGVTA